MSIDDVWQTLLTPPRSAGNLYAWVLNAANHLLSRSRLVAGGLLHRIVEIEFYYHSTDHPDPFAHCDPVQIHPGRWYFHRSHGIYRGGSFKGLDITCGARGAFGGILIRGLEGPDGPLIDGPSLSVDHLLQRTKMPNPAGLDAAIAGRSVWDRDSPLFLMALDSSEPVVVYQSARVGLSLKRHGPGTLGPVYLHRPYRFLTEPKRIRKGRSHLVCALGSQGFTAREICALTGSSEANVRRWLSLMGVREREP